MSPDDISNALRETHKKFTRKRRYQAKVRILFILPLLLAPLVPPSLTPRATAACLSCPQTVQGPPCQEYWRADVVFVGHAIRVEATGWPPNIAAYSEYSKLTARLTIEEAFRGVEGGEMTFAMEDCPYPFKQGERYLVYAHRARDGTPYVRIGSSRTRPFSEAGEDLEYIRSIAHGNEKGRLFGTVTRDVLDLRPHAFRGGKEAGRGRVAGVKVVVENGKSSYEAITGGEGEFEFSELPAGIYDVRVAATATEPGAEMRGVKVFAGGCAPLNVWLQPAGEISGRVLTTDGQPMPGEGVILFAAEGVTDDELDGIENRPPIIGYTDQEGGYRFVRLPAGRYYVLAAIGNQRGVRQAQRRIFYPGVSSLSEATAITLEGGQKKTRLDVRLSQR